MKKFLAGLLALLMLVSSVFVLSSCAKKPQLNLEKAKDALEDNDYRVSYSDDVEDPAYEERLYASKDDHYIVIVKFEKSSTAKLYYQQSKMELDQQIEALEMEIKLAKHLLKTYEDDMKSDEIKELEDEIKDLEKELEEYQEEYVIGRSGKYVWYGDAKAIEDSKD